MSSLKCEELLPNDSYEVQGQAQQIPADKVIQDGDDKLVRSFFKVTVPELATKALSMLGGLNQAAVTVEPELHLILIQGPGGRLSTKWKAPENPSISYLLINLKLLILISFYYFEETFGVMLVQIPVQGGHEGGDIIVQHTDNKKQFDTWQTSSELSHITVFYSDCAHKLENVTFGWRFALVFHLNMTSSTPPVGLSPTPNLPTFLSVNNVREVLKQWPNQTPRLLALPLEHRYSNPPRFAFLKGRDRALAQLLLSVDSIDLHLVQLTKEEEGTITIEEEKEEDRSQCSNMCEKFLKSLCDCCEKKRCNCYRRLLDRVKMGDDGIDDYDTHCWIDVNDQPIEMVPKLNVSFDFDLLDGCKKSLFPPTLVPDKKEVTFSPSSDALAEDEDDNMSESEQTEYQVLLQLCYHRNVLVIWPRKRSLSMAMMYNFPAILDRLDEPDMLTLAINQCIESPLSVWKSNDNGATTLRLVTKCVETATSTSNSN
jgi:hypothetical protein